MLRIKHLSKVIDGLTVIEDLNMTVDDHEIVALVGPSGCGKSTILNLVAGILGDFEGSMETGGSKVGYVFQEDRVLPWLTVYENLRVVRDDVDEKRIADLIRRMHLDGFEDYYPGQLSGGMRQRCGIARAFYYGSDLLLMDEPFKSLDPMLRREMLENLKESWSEEKSSVIFVTHDVEEALMIADRILVMKERPTRVVREFVLPRGKGLRKTEDPAAKEIRCEIEELMCHGKCGDMRREEKMNREKGLPALGIDIGSSTVKLVLCKDGEVTEKWIAPHFGRVAQTLQQGLAEMENAAGDLPVCLSVTGVGADVFAKLFKTDVKVDEIPAVVAGVRKMAPGAGCVIDIGSQSARFITDLDKRVPRFAVNEHCAGGTGSFFEDQMSRLGMELEDYSALVEKAKSLPRLSGRCAVFAKTDIIHRQQEGVPKEDILLGLCFAMIRNYKAAIVKSLPVTKPVAFVGGVTKNTGAIKAVKDVFGLSQEELIITKDACFAGAIGAALLAGGKSCSLKELQGMAENIRISEKKQTLPRLIREEEAYAAGRLCACRTEGRLSLGIDIGSTSTDLVIVDEKNQLVDEQYLRTAGDPEAAVRKGLASIRERFGEICFHAVGVTGSGRQRIGDMIGADAIRDEITAQAKGAVACVPDVDTVFEIGGQDSKYISIKDGEVVDFQMNRICAAGTGSFVEEQAARMNIPLEKFGKMALQADAPAELGERCTVFIESSIAQSEADGVSEENIAAGLCHAIVRNYLHKVVGSKAVGDHIVLQGGVAFNDGIVAAFRCAYGKKLHVLPYFSISGAFGAALLAAEAVGKDGESTFRGFDTLREKTSAVETGAKEQIRKNTEFYDRSQRLILDGYDGRLDPGKKTVGIPYVLMIHKFFPMANAFFKDLGFNVLLTQPTDEDTIALSQQLAQGETCYPVKLIYGHMQQLVDKGVDYIFLPSIHTMKHETSHVAHNYGCVYMQNAPRAIAGILGLEKKGIRLLNPVFDLDFGKQAMAMAMTGLADALDRPKPMCVKALMAGSAAVRRHTAQVEAMGSELLGSLRADEKVLVLITRNYGIGDPVLNMNIPRLLLERGYKVITLSHLPAHDLDISGDHQNLYWPFGQHIISGAKIVANHPNLYAVYLTNHGCGPDSMLNHLFREEMGDKPYLHIEVDEHFSKVGVITRIEAFLNSISHRDTKVLPADFDMKAVPAKVMKIAEKPDRTKEIVLPDFGWYSETLRCFLEGQGYADVRIMKMSADSLKTGKSFTNAKEYVTFAALMGAVAADCGKNAADPDGGKGTQYVIPQTLGAETDGQFARVMRAELDRAGYKAAEICAPVLEHLPENAADFDGFCRAVAWADLIYAMPPEKRSCDETAVPGWESLEKLAAEAGKMTGGRKKICAVGTPLLLSSLNEGVLDGLEDEGYQVLRSPMLEYLWMLWQDQPENDADQMDYLKQKLQRFSELLGENTTYVPVPNALLRSAGSELAGFAGANGRYRYARIMNPPDGCRAVIHVVPRYENTEMLLEMKGIADDCPLPYYNLALDGDWDNAAESRLKSFLYYI